MRHSYMAHVVSIEPRGGVVKSIVAVIGGCITFVVVIPFVMVAFGYSMTFAASAQTDAPTSF